MSVEGLEFLTTAEATAEIGFGFQPGAGPDGFYVRLGEMAFSLSGGTSGDDASVTVNFGGEEQVFDLSNTKVALKKVGGDISTTGNIFDDGVLHMSELPLLAANPGKYLSFDVQGELEAVIGIPVPFAGLEELGTPLARVISRDVFSGQAPQVTIDVAIESGLRDQLLAMFDKVSEIGDSVGTNEALGLKVPGLGLSVDGLLGGTDAVSSWLSFGTVGADYLGGDALTAAGLIETLRQNWLEPNLEAFSKVADGPQPHPHLFGGFDADDRILSFGFSFAPDYNASAPFAGGLAGPAGIELSSQAEVGLNVTGDLGFTINVDLSDFTFTSEDVWLDVAGDNPFRFDLEAKANATDLSFGLAIGGLEVETGGATVDASLGVSIGFDDTNADGRLTLNELGSPSVSPSGGLAFNMPLAGTVNGRDFGEMAQDEHDRLVAEGKASANDWDGTPYVSFSDVSFFDTTGPVVETIGLESLKGALVSLAVNMLAEELPILDWLETAGDLVVDFESNFTENPILEEKIPGTDLKLKYVLGSADLDTPASFFGMGSAIVGYLKQPQFDPTTWSVGDPTPSVSGLQQYLNDNWVSQLPGSGHELTLDFNDAAKSFGISFAARPTFHRDARLELGEQADAFGLAVDGNLNLDFGADVAFDLTFGWGEDNKGAAFDLTKFDFHAAASVDNLLAAATLGPLEMAVGSPNAERGSVVIDFGLSKSADEAGNSQFLPSATLDASLPYTASWLDETYWRTDLPLLYCSAETPFPPRVLPAYPLPRRISNAFPSCPTSLSGKSSNVSLTLPSGSRSIKTEKPSIKRFRSSVCGSGQYSISPLVSPTRSCPLPILRKSRRLATSSQPLPTPPFFPRVCR